MTKKPPAKQEAEKKVKDVTNGLVENVIEPAMHTSLAAVAAAYPIASPFVALLSTFIPSRKMKRAEGQLQEVFERLAKLEVVIDPNWIQSDEFMGIFEECVRGFTQNYQEEKLDAFRAILLKASIGSDLKVDEQEYYLSLVHRLTPLHIKLLRLMNEARQIPHGTEPAISPSVQQVLDVDLSIIVAAYADLEVLQFTNTQSHGIGSYLTVPLERMDSRINESAVKFIEYITQE